MLPLSDSESDSLLRFNQDVLDQALELVALHELPGAPTYGDSVGLHLRHVIEHFEALLGPPRHHVADYDSRPRDASLERSASLARRRLLALRQHLARRVSLDEPVCVRGKGGLGGEFDFRVNSTVGRELVFVASHAIHHFALLKVHCQQRGIRLRADFGKAPATIAHERATNPPPSHKDPTSCMPSLTAA
jgi:hypothetical protein